MSQTNIAYSVRDLLDVCKAVERELGRAADHVRHGPRPIDVGVLLLGEIDPLLELDPDLRLPGGEPLHDRLAAVADQRVDRYTGGP
jgi:2-amino-4-hydroxy-6-hydroxymethyldihydropteridine diphosphokinase